ncbi:agmatinase [Oscillatoria sp. FACHB-1406]|uniref:agmatinase n=1 Tax=Oscillatoria sp. FACHB-1406 TaxID=2692846 RepID=UPI0016856AE7|nr:agmatinase [Oscillatoria sp. FACHB-1406]MBD2578683.1 agmatinase [Oscillatoria sp. FACHB-1406]
MPTLPSLPPFLDSTVESSYEAARVVILPIPYEATTTYRKGCESGPEAILAASPQLEYYDVELKRETCFEIGIHTCEPVADTRQQPDLAPERMVETVKETVMRLVADGKFVIALGGEHGISVGVVAAYQELLSEPFTVIQIDAHGDLRHEYEGSIYNHACIMRRVVDMGLPTLPVGIRSICQEEATLINDKQIPVQWAHEIAENPNWIEEAIAQISTQKVFITIDLDGLDPSLMPGVGTPQPGGLSWYDLMRFLRRVFATREVIGCDIMELAPVVDSVVSEFTAAKLVYKLIGYQLASRG